MGQKLFPPEFFHVCNVFEGWGAVRPVFPLLVFQLSKQQNRTRTTSSTVLGCEALDVHFANVHFIFGGRFFFGGLELEWSLVATSLEGFSVTGHDSQVVMSNVVFSGFFTRNASEPYSDKELPLRKAWGGVPKRESSKNWHFHNFEPYRKPHLDTSWLEVQQRYSSYRAILVAIVSQNSFGLVSMRYRTIIARYVAKRVSTEVGPWFLDPSKRASGLLCRGFLYRKHRALTHEGGGKRTVRGGVQNTFLGGVSFVRFSTPLGHPNSQSLAVKNFGSRRVEFEVLMCGGICVKFLAAIFPGNWRTKILAKKFAKISPHFSPILSLKRLRDQNFTRISLWGTTGINPPLFPTPPPMASSEEVGHRTIFQSAPKERRRRCAEKRVSKRVFLESPFLLCPLIRKA